MLTPLFIAFPNPHRLLPSAGSQSLRVFAAEPNTPSVAELVSIMKSIGNLMVVASISLAASVVSLTLAACDDDDAVSTSGSSSTLNELSGGDGTAFSASSHAFTNPLSNLDEADMPRFLSGDADFEATFVTAPAIVNEGLGPIFNATSCEACHPRDGRGPHPDDGGGPLAPLLLRLSLAGTNPDGTGSPVPVPGFGGQLQDDSIFGFDAEGTVDITYEEIPGTYGDGEAFSLRRPIYDIASTYTAFPQDVLVSPRIGPPVFGLGMLEAVTDETILAGADPDDADGDGISGKANMVWDFQTNALAVGRFGWKANQPHLLQQVAAAYHGDMGISTSYFPTENSEGQPQVDGIADEPELEDRALLDTTFYVQTLAVPARRNVNDPAVIRGERLFFQANCNSCHTPVLETGGTHPIVALRNQRIQPFTDLLLHDMGEALADNRPDFEASGREWRTPPLWGIGLLERVNGHTNLLHDGRARSIAEAILWHGGEAEESKQAFRTMTKEEREALIAFLESN